jgi:hypothetical protein
MLAAALIVLNIPVYLFIGWLIFDSKDKAADTLFEAVVSILKAVFLPIIHRVHGGDDDDGEGSILTTAIFLCTCAAVVYGEYYLITTYLLGTRP